MNLDNRLIETANGRYETVNDAFWVSFAKKASDDDTVLLSFEGYTLSWNVSVIKALNLKGSWQKLGTSVQESVTSETVTPQLAQDVSGVVRDVALCDANERSVFSKEEISSTFMSVSGFSYRNAFSSGGSVDLKYTVSDNRLEEDIIWMASIFRYRNYRFDRSSNTL